MTGVVTAEEIAAWWPVPGTESHKYTRGVVGADTGSPQYPGAALLAISGAPGVDPGVVRYLRPAPCDLVVERFPSVVLADGQVQAVVTGSGRGVLVDTRPRLREALEWRVPLAIDADVSRLLPVDLPTETLLTLHMGELVRLLEVECDEVEANPVAAAILAAGWSGATIFFKGVVQSVASSGGSMRLALSGPAWTTQTGSDDVLTGACGILLAAGLLTGRAGLMAASLQALITSYFPGPYPPDVQTPRFPEVVWGPLAPDQQ